MHKLYIDKIIASDNSNKMKELKELMVDIISYIKTMDAEEYKDIECELYEISEGKLLNEEKAKEIINKMKPYGMHWTLEQTNKVKNQYNLNDIRDIDFWVVMNSAYNDYHNLFDENIDDYILYSKDFILDDDAKECKVYRYFTEIPI